VNFTTQDQFYAQETVAVTLGVSVEIILNIFAKNGKNDGVLCSNYS
jgi:hypothetical protein